MGKHKPTKRSRGHRQNTTQPYNMELVDELPESAVVEAAKMPSLVENIMDQIKDPSTEERAYGCMQMARLVSQPKAIELMLKQDVVKITAPLFLDECVDVRRSALGAMRNMSIYGEEAVCATMVKNDVITPLSAVIKKFGENHSSEQEKMKKDTASLILFEATELMSNLCENNDRALQIFNKDGILSVLLPLMNPELCGYRLSIAVARCLHIVSEKNFEVSRVCQQPDVFSRLMDIVTSSPSTIDAVLYRTNVMGIILNLSETDLSKYFDPFIKVASDVLDMDHLPLVSLAVNGKPVSDEKKELDKDLSQQDIDKLVSAQRVCLEMLANLCCTDDEWEEMEEEIGNEMADNEEDVNEAGDAGVTGQQEEVVESLCLPSEVHSAFLKHNILPKILRKAQPLETSQVSSLESAPFGKSILQRLEDLQARALLCLSNVIGALYDSSDPPPLPVTDIWTQLYSVAKAYQGKNEDYIWAITSAMRSVLQKMSKKHEDQISMVTSSDLDFLVQMGTASSNPETQMNTIRMISTIGCVLAAKTETHSLVKTIGELLLKVCQNNDNVVVVSESLDSIYDVFKEDETDPIAKEINLVQQLKSIQPNFRSKIGKERKNLGEHYGIVMMARDNLGPFIKYKKARRL